MEKFNYINKIIKENEGEQMSFFPDIDIEGISKVVCAFLNTKGGHIIIGIDKQKNSVELHDYDNRFKELQHSIINNIKPESIISFIKTDLQGKNIIQIDVIQGSRQPYSLKNKV